MVLGAVVGAGFAAFESAGYALQTMLDNLNDQSIFAILEIETFRAVLAPFGHITWTALIGGALFASSRGGRFRVTRGLVLTILGVIALHALWDQSSGWAAMLTKGLVMDAGWHSCGRTRSSGWSADRLRPDLVQRLSTTCCSASGVIGATWIVLDWRRYGRASAAKEQASSAPATFA